MMKIEALKRAKRKFFQISPGQPNTNSQETKPYPTMYQGYRDVTMNDG